MSAGKCLVTNVPYAEEWLSTFTGSARSEFLTPLFKFFTLFGEEYFFLAIVVLALHFSHRRSAMQLAFLVVGVGLMNSWMKGIFQECRPSTVDFLVKATGYSFPSGHAQIGGAFWGFLILHARYKWQRLSMFFIMLAVALSRPYLGVHYIHDVGIGLVLGLILSWVFYCWGDWILQSFKKTVILLALSFGLSFLNPEESFKIFGALAGLLLGYQWTAKRKFPSKLYGTERTLSLLFSFICVVIFWGVLKVVFAKLSIESPFVTMTRYFILCLWLTYISPSLAIHFVHLRRARVS